MIKYVHKSIIKFLSFFSNKFRIFSLLQKKFEICFLLLSQKLNNFFFFWDFCCRKKKSKKKSFHFFLLVFFSLLTFSSTTSSWFRSVSLFSQICLILLKIIIHNSNTSCFLGSRTCIFFLDF